MLLVLINLEIGLVMQDSKLHSKGTHGEVKEVIVVMISP